jgi:DNA gyrase subunit A
MSENTTKPTSGGREISTMVEEEMKESYLNYAMSVIVSRAIPDVRDGLKPSQRRILIAMNDLGLGPRGKFRKCAKIAGDTSGNYHPHGEQVVYPTLVRMAQEFSIRYRLVDGQGNFGSIDGDPPAAMRYTEARMTRNAVSLLEDIDLDTVDFISNYDETREEPVVLPSKFPNLLTNGASGIAVGMATSIPPHNLGEVCSGILALLDDPEISISGLRKHLPGPDFPTGGIIMGDSGIRNAYEKGRGIVKVRGRVEIEDGRLGRKVIVISEIPYNVNKSNFIEHIASLVKDERITGIGDVRDLSSRDGMRIEIEVRKGEDDGVVLNQLYSMTALQDSFSIIMISLVNGRPRTLNLKEMLVAYVDHRKEIIRRRTRFLLEKAEREAHLLEGLVKALDIIDEIIALIRSSAAPSEARGRLMEEYSFTDLQADAILRMTLSKLTNLEMVKLKAALKALQAQILEFRSILGKESLVLDIIREDLHDLYKLSDSRRTELSSDLPETYEKGDLIAEEDMVVVLSHLGYVKRVPLTIYRKQKRGGRGIKGAGTKDKDFVEHLFVASTHDYIFFFTDRGRVHRMKVYDLPQLERVARGKPIGSLLNLRKGERITECVFVQGSEGYLVMATRQGVVKRILLSAFNNTRRGGIQAINLPEEDRLIGVAITNGENEVVLGTEQGLSIRFREGDMRSMGRTAYGVNGINLSQNDHVVDMIVAEKDATILTVSENGYGKRSLLDDYRLQSRAGKGIINIKATDRNGLVVGMKEVNDEDDILLITQGGIIVRLRVKEIRTMGRNTQGVRVIRLDKGDRLVAIARVEHEDNGNN